MITVVLLEEVERYGGDCIKFSGDALTIIWAVDNSEATATGASAGESDKAGEKGPQTLEEAIERKLQQEQESLEYEFRLEKETKEAERKRIDRVTKGVSREELLRHLAAVNLHLRVERARGLPEATAVQLSRAEA